MWWRHVDALIQAALEEDMPRGDITTESLIPSEATARAILLAKENGVLAGIPVAERVFKKIDASSVMSIHHRDGESVRKGDKIADIKGPAVALLKGERTALNFLQRLSGIATTTRKFVDAVSGTRTRVLDTRKTTPGLRILEKYAVKMGGGENHRMSLSEMVLIKDNHLKFLGDVAEAVRRARKNVKPGIKIEVEVTSLEQAQQAVESGADILMLDNMSLAEIKKVVAWARRRIPIEVSGSLTPAKAARVAEIGVDFVSVGALTHSYRSLDISMEFLG